MIFLKNSLATDFSSDFFFDFFHFSGKVIFLTFFSDFLEIYNFFWKKHFFVLILFTFFGNLRKKVRKRKKKNQFISEKCHFSFFFCHIFDFFFVKNSLATDFLSDLFLTFPIFLGKVIFFNFFFFSTFLEICHFFFAYFLLFWKFPKKGKKKFKKTLFFRKMEKCFFFCIFFTFFENNSQKKVKKNHFFF